MTPRRQIHLVGYLKTGPTGTHPGGWRHPESTLNDFLEPTRYENIARELEAACFDGCFFADLFGLYDIHDGSFDAYIRKGGQVSYLDPLTVLPLMARVTSHLGIATTISTSFNNAYGVARQLASLDILSKGRIGWNVVTSATDLEAQNFGIDELPPKDERYDLADEFLEACFALWNCWEEDAFVLDKKAGIFADPSKIRYANYAGKRIRTRGPLSMPRSPQVTPVIMQAGASPRGREFAARWAEIIFAPASTKEALLEFTADMHTRMDRIGRDPRQCVIMPQIRTIVGETESIARERADYIQSLIDGELQLAVGSSTLGVDLTKVETFEAMESRQKNQGIQGVSDLIKTRMETDRIGLKEAVRKPRNDVIGTPEMIADHMQDLFEAGACDGFIVSPIHFPTTYEQFCRAVVPELQRRGIFRTEYKGRTLRENLRS